MNGVPDASHKVHHLPAKKIDSRGGAGEQLAETTSKEARGEKEKKSMKSRTRGGETAGFGFLGRICRVTFSRCGTRFRRSHTPRR